MRRTRVALSVLFIALLGVATNVATGVLPASWKHHLWVAWPLMLVLVIATVTVEVVVRKDDEPTDLPSTQAREELIRRVRRYWVTGVLEQSLYNEARIQLDLVVSEANDHPWDIAVTWTNGMREPLPPGMQMAEAFTLMDHRLVILGAPGAGKTTMLLELAKSLLLAAENESRPVPVVLPLASWARQRKTIAEWIVDELVESYGMPRRLSSAWLRNHHILTLFDGLDEVAAEYRSACVSELNKYLQANPTSSAICCREAEYMLLKEQVRLHGIVTIQPMRAEQTRRFLDEAGPGLHGLRVALVADPELWQLASSPLLLSIMALAYRDGPEAPVEARQAGPRHRLYAQYLRTMLRWRKNHRYPPEISSRYLHVLADRLHLERQTVFTLDLLGPSWLPEGRLIRISDYAKPFAVALSCGLMFVVSWPLTGASTAAAAAVVLGISLITQLASHDHSDTTQITWRSRQDTREFKSVGPPREQSLKGDATSYPIIKSLVLAPRGFMAHGLGDKLAGSALALVVGAALSFQEFTIAGPVYSITLLISYLLVSGLIDGFIEELASSGRTIMRSREVPSPALRPRVYLAIRVGFVWSVIIGLLVAFVTRLAPSAVLPPHDYALLIGFASFVLTFASIAGEPLLEQVMIRQELARFTLFPRPCLPFFDFMAECLILRKVGNGYIFVHRELLDFLADPTTGSELQLGPAGSHL
uniref:NACHT domain-containing protein n=1 Tax=Herbidospora sakaeratensis TaxID=564415 RepID=UPI0007803F27|nr:NACHT domain-containing protein [Herbidospora sakaeratensis]